MKLNLAPASLLHHEKKKARGGWKEKHKNSTGGLNQTTNSQSVHTATTKICNWNTRKGRYSSVPNADVERERTGSWWRLQSKLLVTTNLWILYTEGDTPWYKQKLFCKEEDLLTINTFVPVAKRSLQFNSFVVFLLVLVLIHVVFIGGGGRRGRRRGCGWWIVVVVFFVLFHLIIIRLHRILVGF